MGKRLRTLWIGMICILLVLLVCGTALAGSSTPTDLDDPSDPPSPTDPTKPTDPVNPTDPTKPTDPSGQTDPPAQDWVIQGGVLVACNLKNAEKLTIPDGVKEIGPKVFKGFKKLKTVILPDSVEKIGKGSFADCPKLEKVKLTKKSKLKEIEKKAFRNCKKLDITFVPKGVKVAEDAFQGAGKANKTPKPTKKQDHTPPPTSTPTPVQPKPRPGGGGGSSGPKIPHSKNNATVGPDYDLLDMNGLTGETEEAMTQLELGGEILALGLNSQNGAAGDSFTASGKSWEKEKEKEQADTLILTAADGEGQNVWSVNGEVLRRLYKSGIRHLVFRSGDQIAVLETEGFLAGWNYDGIKSRGTANRRFEYEVKMTSGSPAQWQVSIEGETYELTGDEHAGIYMKGVYSGSAEVLDQPYDKLFAKE